MHADVRATIKYAEQLGFTLLDGLDGRGHYRLRHTRTGETVTIPNTPSDYRSMTNARAMLRRIAGVRSDSPAAGHYRKAVPLAERPLSASELTRRSEAERLAGEQIDDLQTLHRELRARLAELSPGYRTRTQALDLCERIVAVEQRLAALWQPVPVAERVGP